MPRCSLGAIDRAHFAGRRQERQFLSSASFFVTFRHPRDHPRHSPRCRPVSQRLAAWLHIDHLVWGLFGLLGVGYLWMDQVGAGMEQTSLEASRLTALLSGAGVALTLDEFALWLHLEDVYWSKEGRDSIDAVVLFAPLLSIGFWGRRFFRDLGHEAPRVAGLRHDGEPMRQARPLGH